MKTQSILKTLSSLTLAVAASLAHADAAQDRANQERCAAMNASVQRTFNDAVQKRIPKQDPGSFVQDGYDIKGLMKQDVSSGLSKLMNLNFNSIIDSLVNRAMESVNRRAQSSFNSGVNKILQDYRIPNVTLQGPTTQSIPNMSTFTWGPAAQATNPSTPTMSNNPATTLPPTPTGPSMPSATPAPRSAPAPTGPTAPATPANPYTRAPGR
ncbi:MAG: hypothetical protein O9327_05080 [Polaromonas sp.]|nr:hypothetical protein [Polaromonas sp.]